MILAVPVPVSGRHPLLKHTIRRLFGQVGFEVKVVCVGDESDRAICEAQGALFFPYANKPLGAKWQYAFDMCKLLDPDAVLYAGSSDWFCRDWCLTLLHEGAGHGMIGKTDINFIDIESPHHFRAVYWPRYANGSGREQEHIGAGRVLTRKCLDAMGWGVFDRRLDSSLDYSMCQHVQAAGQTCYTSVNPSLVSASISTFAWGNKHNFSKMCKMAHCRVLEPDDTRALVGAHFSELHSIF